MPSPFRHSILLTTVLVAAASTSWAGAYGEDVEADVPAPAAAPTEAAAAEPAKPVLTDRLFFNFIEDAETARGLWVEVREILSDETDTPTDEFQLLTQMIAAYGGEIWEAGMLLPYGYVQYDDGPGNDDRHDNLGDLSLWGKVVPLRTEMFSLGGGLEIAFPTGGGPFTTDEYGFNPFLTGSVEAGPASVRAHIGYEAYTGDSVNEGVDYSVAALVPMSEMVTLRTEIFGAHYTDNAPSGWDDPVSIGPGIDLRAIDGNWQVMLRLFGAAGLTNEAPDYQVGVGFVLAQTAG